MQAGGIECVCVCVQGGINDTCYDSVCVCFLPIHSGHQDRISHPPSFCGACLNFSREKDSAIPFPRVDRDVEFCVLTI